MEKGNPQRLLLGSKGMSLVVGMLLFAFFVTSATSVNAQSPQDALEDWRKQNEFVQRMLQASVDSNRSSPSTKQPDVPDDIRWVSLARENHPILDAANQLNIDAKTNSRLSAGNHLQLLLNHESGVEKFAMIDDAKSTLFLSALIFHCDQGGKKLLRKLIAAKKRGVDVRVVLDGIGAYAGFGCFQWLRKAGVKLVISGRSLSPASVDWEMHDKLFIQDGKTAIVGGQNLGSWYFDASGTDNNYRDTDVKVEGPVVRDIARRFVRIWEEQVPNDATLDSYSRTLDEMDAQDARLATLGKTHYDRWLGAERGKGVCRFVAQDPHRNTFYVYDAYIELAKLSRRRIQFHAMSFDPLGEEQPMLLLEQLKALADRLEGSVDVITNGPGLLTSNAMPPPVGTWFGSSFLANAHKGLQGSKIQVHAYRTFLHSKVYSFDDVAVGIGSFNFDPSGIRCQESTLICVDEELAKEVRVMFRKDLENSTQVPLELPQASQP